MDICPECGSEDLSGGLCSHCFYDEREECPRCHELTSPYDFHNGVCVDCNWEIKYLKRIDDV